MFPIHNKDQVTPRRIPFGARIRPSRFLNKLICLVATVLLGVSCSPQRPPKEYFLTNDAQYTGLGQLDSVATTCSPRMIGYYEVDHFGKEEMQEHLLEILLLMGLPPDKWTIGFVQPMYGGKVSYNAMVCADGGAHHRMWITVSAFEDFSGRADDVVILFFVAHEIAHSHKDLWRYKERAAKLQRDYNLPELSDRPLEEIACDLLAADILRDLGFTLQAAELATDFIGKYSAAAGVPLRGSTTHPSNAVRLEYLKFYRLDRQFEDRFISPFASKKK